jgi:beta-galactosidase
MHRRHFLLGTGATAAAIPLSGMVPLLAGTGKALASSPKVPMAVASGPRQILSLNRGWRFHEGDIPFPELLRHEETYENAKAGISFGAASPAYDDTGWAPVELPHDFVSFQRHNEKANVSQGYRPRGYAWYRTTLRFDESDRGRHIELQLDGISTYATIWFNGTLVRRSWSGYSAVNIDLTPFITYGNAGNSLVVRVDAQSMEGWWYEGGGIYRNVRIVKRASVHIATDGVSAHPVQQGDGWTVPLVVQVNSSRKETATVRLTAELAEPDGKILAKSEATGSVTDFDSTTLSAPLQIANPQLWSLEKPTLYTVTTRLWENGALLDEVTTEIGFRTQRFDADKGFFLNDRPVKLKGVCIHQDHAGVGTAIPYGLLEFRLRRLKELGCNAIRCSHNAQDPAFYRLCDRLGFLVMDENRCFNPSPDQMAQLEWLVRAHRNHPSIILWSVFNEEPMQGTEAGYEMVLRMADVVRELDPARPVTAAMNGGLFTKVNVSQAVDVVGFNYQPKDYDAFHKANPTKPMLSSEDTSAFSTRGEFITDKERHIASSYDDEAAPWGATHRKAWKEIATRDFVAGGFVWTGFDYHGEPTPYTWPSNSSFFGIMDLCGFEKTAFHIHQAQWVDDRPVLAIAPHWNWPGQEGQPIRVMVMTNVEEVELRLNGKSLGRQKGDRLEMNWFQVPYQPGKLEALGFSGGRPVVRASVETAGPAKALRLVADRTQLAGDGIDAQPIRVEVVDAKGRVVPDAKPMIRFAIEEGRIIGLGNGDPNSIEPEKGDRRSAFNGLAQVIVQSHPGTSGKLRLSAEADGLKPAKLSIDITPDLGPAYQPVFERNIFTLGRWRVSPWSATPLDPMAGLAGNDMNSWSPYRSGSLLPAPDREVYVMCAITIEPYAGIQKAGGKLVFDKVAGAVEVFSNGRRLGGRTEATPAPLALDLPPAAGKQKIAVLFRVQPGQPYGLEGAVRIL